ncbi:MAG: ABC transporter ATP-binding protein [Clostridia bacterium]|nr:ABC transporter ATP-binding protein [Clostridia bacterium]
MIKLHNVCAGYGGREVLHGVDLEAEKGQVTTIIGVNGCGKSTLLKTIMGFVPISGGDITVDGRSIKNMTEQELAREIAYLSQGKNVPDISAGRMVLHGRFPYLSYPRKYRRSDYEAAADAMARMGIADLSDRMMTELSGGMRQKVYIAMALAQQSGGQSYAMALNAAANKVAPVNAARAQNAIARGLLYSTGNMNGAFKSKL